MAIIIGWKDGNGRKWPERLDIDPDHLDADEIKNLKETKQWLPDKEVFIWKVKCSLEERDNGDLEIAVKYTQNQQDAGNLLRYTERYENQYCFGKNRIIVNRDPETGQARRKGICKWKCKDPDESAQVRWKVIGRPRLRIDREQWDRESRFRDNVLDEDGRCVISKETTRAVLDAAHLRPVKEGGEECIENGFILRTDLHRLFDRGMFFISPEDGTIVFDKNLSKYYKELLCHSRLPQPTRCRVREALQERWENPWT